LPSSWPDRVRTSPVAPLSGCDGEAWCFLFFPKGVERHNPFNISFDRRLILAFFASEIAADVELISDTETQAGARTRGNR
jgi:hypothetical protein